MTRFLRLGRQYYNLSNILRLEVNQLSIYTQGKKEPQWQWLVSLQLEIPKGVFEKGGFKKQRWPQWRNFWFSSISRDWWQNVRVSSQRLILLAENSGCRRKPMLMRVGQTHNATCCFFSRSIPNMSWNGRRTKTWQHGWWLSRLLSINKGSALTSPATTREHFRSLRSSQPMDTLKLGRQRS